MTTDITDVLAGPDCGPHMKHHRWVASQGVAALAAATADGPLVEDVTCPTCGGNQTVPARHPERADMEAWGELLDPCPDCTDGTVRIVVHRADPALVERLRLYADRDFTNGDDLRAAARIVGGSQ